MLTIGEPELWKNKGRVFIELGVLDEQLEWADITSRHITRDQGGVKIVLKTRGALQLAYKLPMDSPAYWLLHSVDIVN